MFMRAWALATLLLAVLLFRFRDRLCPDCPQPASLTFSARPPSMAYNQFILFGDSLFQHSSSQERGFNLAPALQAEFIRRLDVVNRGFSGYNSDQALEVFPKIVPHPDLAKVRFLLVLIGANDACIEGAAGSQHVPLDRYKSNLNSIVTHTSLKQHNARVILVTPPPINEYACDETDRVKGFTQPRRTAEHTKLYADAAREVARTNNLAVVDLWTLFMKQAGWQEGHAVIPGSRSLPLAPQLRILLHDGLHFTSVAYTMMFQEIMRTIERVWPDQMPEKLPFVLPAWNDPKAWD